MGIINEINKSPVQSMSMLYAVLYSITYIIYCIIKKIYYKYIMMSKKINYPSIIQEEEIIILEKPRVFKFVSADDLLKYRQNKQRQEEIKRKCDEKELKLKNQEELNEKMNIQRKYVQEQIFKADKKGKRGTKIKKKKVPKIIKHELRKAGYSVEKIKKCMKETYYWIEFIGETTQDIFEVVNNL